MATAWRCLGSLFWWAAPGRGGAKPISTRKPQKAGKSAFELSPSSRE